MSVGYVKVSFLTSILYAQAAGDLHSNVKLECTFSFSIGLRKVYVNITMELSKDQCGFYATADLLLLFFFLIKNILKCVDV